MIDPDTLQSFFLTVSQAGELMVLANLEPSQAGTSLLARSEVDATTLTQQISEFVRSRKTFLMWGGAE